MDKSKDYCKHLDVDTFETTTKKVCEECIKLNGK